jgi:hypothetical protein
LHSSGVYLSLAYACGHLNNVHKRSAAEQWKGHFIYWKTSVHPLVPAQYITDEQIHTFRGLLLEKKTQLLVKGGFNQRNIPAIL